MKQPSDTDALALARHAAVSWIAEARNQNFTLARATALASERTWGGKTYSASTLEGWYYDWRHQGFTALHRQVRRDKGTRKALSPEQCEAILAARRQYPQVRITVLVRQLVKQEVLLPGTFSMPTVYRLMAEHQLDAHSAKHLPPPCGGPTKAFECALANELWMTDLMFGPTLKLANGQVMHTRLFGLLDDCSRLVPHAQYYESEKLCWFLDCFRQGLARRGFPDKLYTDYVHRRRTWGAGPPARTPARTPGRAPRRAPAGACGRQRGRALGGRPGLGSAADATADEESGPRGGRASAAAEPRASGTTGRGRVRFPVLRRSGAVVVPVPLRAYAEGRLRLMKPGPDTP